MSHIVEATTKITNPNLVLLREALKLLAEQYGGSIQDHYLDYYWDKHPASTGLALHIPQSEQRPAAQSLPRGIGLMLDQATGALIFKGDPWRVEDFYHQIQQQIVQRYVTLAAAAALKKLRYRTTSQQTEEGQMVITGVKYV